MEREQGGKRGFKKSEGSRKGSAFEPTINFSRLDGHVESQENKKLCFCMASLALNSRLAEACRAKTKLFILLRLNMVAE